MPRPRSVTIIAWIFIAVGAAGLLKDWWPLLTPNAAHQLSKLLSEGWSDLGPAWTTRFLGVVGGAWLLRGENWARWLLVAWMVFHIALSLGNWLELFMHCLIFLPIMYVLFRTSAARFFEPKVLSSETGQG
jgi:hypothetical protein